MKLFTRSISALLVCSLASIGITGCNTMRGAGRDIQKGGKAVEDAAKNVQEDINAPMAREYMVIASSQTGGSIDPKGVTGISHGKSGIFTINADPGFHVADVLVDGKSMGSVSRHTFQNTTDDHTISALFREGKAR